MFVQHDVSLLPLGGARQTVEMSVFVMVLGWPWEFVFEEMGKDVSTSLY